MSSLAVRVLPPVRVAVSNIYEETALSDHLIASIEESLATIDFNQETVCRINLLVKQVLFHRNIREEGVYSCYAEVQTGVDRNYYIIPEKQEIKSIVSRYLTKCWQQLAGVVEKYQEHGPLAYVEGKIQFDIDTVEKASNLPQPTQSFQIGFGIFDQNVCSARRLMTMGA